ncbi:MAG: hypothetical protein WC356_02145 [Candidatus Micrarchaeia archaeon]|jgi:hypothetical protein
MNSIKIYGVIANGEFQATPEQQRIETHYLQSFKDGTLVERIVKKYSQPKTQQQLGAYFGLALTMIVAEFNDRGYDTSYLLRIDTPTGIGITKYLLKDYLYSVCPIYNDNGERITLAKASIEQTAKHFDDVRSFCASQWGIVIPDPDKNFRNNKEKQ